MLACIDIGSNSVRLLIKRNSEINEKQIETTVLSKGLSLTGLLSQDSMEATLNAVVSFYVTAKKSGATDIYIFATEAMRSAKNAPEFAAKIENTVKAKVEIIDGIKESKLGLLGVLGDYDTCGNIIDIGGASVEVISGSVNHPSYTKSLPLGTGRLLDLSGTNRTKIENFIRHEVTKFEKRVLKDIISIGGTATSLSAMNLKLTKYDPLLVHGSILTIDNLKSLIDLIFDNPTDLGTLFPTLSEKRRPVIGHGAIMLKSLLEYFNAEYTTVSENDNMEGYLIDKTTNKY